MLQYICHKNTNKTHAIPDLAAVSRADKSKQSPTQQTDISEELYLTAATITTEGKTTNQEKNSNQRSRRKEQLTSP